MSLTSVAVVGAILLVLANGFFVAAEFSLVKVRRTRLDELAAKGSRRARIARGLLDHLDDYLGATQLGITLASLALGWIGEPAFAALIEPPLHALGVGPELLHGIALALAFTCITVLHIVLGELAPKTMALQRAEKVVLWLAIPMRAFHFVFYPFLWVLNRASALVLRPFGLRPGGEHESPLGADELQLVVAASQASGLLPERATRIIERSLSLGRRMARELMTPRADVKILSTKQNISESLALVGESGYSRFPLCEDGDIDDVVGIIHARDLLAAALDLRKTLRDVARKPVFVPGRVSAADLLQQFRQAQTHLGIVVDEYGGTLGIITLENVIEVIVGPILDETDEEERAWQPTGDGGFVVDAGVPASEAIERLHLDMPDRDASVSSLGGLVTATLGRLPAVGDRVQLWARWVEIASMERLRPTRIRVFPPDHKA